MIKQNEWFVDPCHFVVVDTFETAYTMLIHSFTFFGPKLKFIYQEIRENDTNKKEFEVELFIEHTSSCFVFNAYFNPFLMLQIYTYFLYL